MADLAQHKGIVKMDASSTATALTDVSSTSVGFTLKPTKSIGKHFNLANDWQQITEGGLGITVTLKTEINTTVGSAYGLLYLWYITASQGLNRTFQFQTPDGSVGSYQVAGEFYLEAPDNLVMVEAGKGDAQIASWTLHSDGAVTVSVL